MGIDESRPLRLLHLKCGNSGNVSRRRVRASERSEQVFEPGGMQRIKQSKGNQLQKQGEGEERQEIQGHAGWKEKAQKTSVEAALVIRTVLVWSPEERVRVSLDPLSFLFFIALPSS